MGSAANLEEDAIQYVGPLVITLFQNIFDAIWNHAHPSTTPVQATATAATATAKVIQATSPTSTITSATVANIVGEAVAAGSINAPGSTTAPGQAITPIENTFTETIPLKDKLE